MTRALLWLLAALALGAIAGQMMLDDPGYVLVTRREWMLETSLWVALAGVAILFVVLLFALGLVNSLVDAANTLRRWRAERRARKAQALISAGLAQYAAADWRKATSTLMKAAELVDVPLLTRLAAARAAEQDGRAELAAQVLREARSSAGDATAMVDVELAALRLRQGDAASARLVLERLPRHPQALRLLAEACAQLSAWRDLVALLPALRPLLAAAEWHALAQRACTSHLAAVAGDAGYASRKARIDALLGSWRDIPADLRTDEEITAAFSSLLVRHDAAEEARGVLEKALQAQWSDRLAALYGRLDVDKPLEQLATAEKWLTMRPTNAALLLAAGRISLRNRLWGKARDYFEASVARETTAEACAELVRLYARLGEDSKAAQYLRRHAELTGSELPKLPLPTART